MHMYTLPRCHPNFFSHYQPYNSHIPTYRVVFAKYRNEGKIGFQQLRSYRDEIETWNREEVPFSLLIDSRGLSVAEGL